MKPWRPAAAVSRPLVSSVAQAGAVPVSGLRCHTPGAVVDGGAVGVLLAEGGGVGVKHGGWG